ncbi:hypothetical protein [Methylophaga sp.]|uniref:hypothetical protein n=1 Tax=Methylophaga sp. TaxID=2024840 RepID=UPI00140021FC|nr:hypothetical protein [Methylophaga sp.]MTI64024.1 hypothetical protein [Methylophaga sp.]
MAENSADDILEEGSGEEPQAKKKGLSTALLIKIAAGLGVVLIALIVSFFFLSQSADVDTEDTEQTTQSESEAEAAPTESETESSNTEDTIVLPEVPSDETAEEPSADNASEFNPAVGLAATGASAVSSPVTQPTTKILSELVALQQQMAGLQEENQMLIKRVEALAKENEALKSKTRQIDNTNPDAIINDEQLVNSDDIPLYYRESGSGAPQPELEPKWGDFDEYGSDS